MSSPPDEIDDGRRSFTRRARAAYPDLVRFCARRTAPASAEDVAADSLATAWARRADAPRTDDAWRAWVFGIARHHLLSTGRAASRRDALAVRIAEHAPSSDHPTDAADLRVDLAAAWRRLTPAQQEVIALVAWDGLDTVAAAAVLGIAPVTYRVRLTRARAALRSHLQPAAAARPATRTSPTSGATA